MLQIDLDTINIFGRKEEYLLYQQQNVRRAHFYIFSQKRLPPKKITKQEFTHLYFNFRILWSDQNAANLPNNERKSLSDITEN